MDKPKANNSNFTKEEKDKLIKKEIARLKKVYKDIDKDKLRTVQSLIAEAAFMTITLEDLRTTINREGTRSFYQNGEFQWGTKSSPEYDQYIKTVANHMKIIKQLTDLLPETPPKEVENDGFEAFVNSRTD